MNDDPQDSDNSQGRPRDNRERASLFGRRIAQSPSEALHPEAAPPPPGRRVRKTSALAAFSGFLTFLLVLAFLVGAGVVFANRSVREAGPLAQDKVVLIPQGSGSEEVVEELVVQGVIDSGVLFKLALLVEGYSGKLKAGEYLFKQNCSLQEAIDTIVQGRSILHAVTIPEGLTSLQIVEKLREDEALAGDIRDLPREGALLPETYKFQRGDSRDKLLQKMAHDQKSLLEEIWRRRAADLPLSSPYELVTLASIVEKETGKADERPRVAGVFINRLRKHMRLQSDPTIVYGLVAGQGALGRSLTRADIDAPSAYNTYQIDGLPPGPIANPGRAAMEAVANPSRTGELYFVADGTGGHVFADSLDVHNRNVLRWRQIEQINKAKGAPGRDDHTELEPSTDFGAPPPQAEFAARRSGALPTPTLRPDPAMIARLAPSLPGAQAPPRSLAEFSIARGAAPKVEAEDIAYADAPMGGITRAENELDGPAQEPGQAPATMPVSPRLQAEMRARAARYGGGALDGPAAPVEAGALAYANGPVNAAPNGKPRIIDASEGTALDPLLDKSWDLNSPKNVDMSTPKALLGK